MITMYLIYSFHAHYLWSFISATCFPWIIWCACESCWWYSHWWSSYEWRCCPCHWNGDLTMINAFIFYIIILNARNNTTLPFICSLYFPITTFHFEKPTQLKQSHQKCKTYFITIIGYNFKYNVPNIRKRLKAQCYKILIQKHLKLIMQ